jgi:hypothetical protein
MGSRQSEDTNPQNHSPNLAINWDSITQDGREELLRARGDEAQSIANTLDHVFTASQVHLPKESLSTLQILSESGLHEKQRSRCSITLQKLCGACCLLPGSHVISDGLELTDDSPVAHGGFANVYQGSYKGRLVALKALKLLSQADEKVISKKVSVYPHFRSQR